MAQPLHEHKSVLTLGLRQGKYRGSSYDIANETIKYLRRVVAAGKFSSLEELLDLIRAEGQDLCNAEPKELVVSNMSCKVLKLIREEFARIERGGVDLPAIDPYDSLHRMWTDDQHQKVKVGTKELRQGVIESLSEFLTEMEGARENIAAQATDHIQNGDIVMTIGDSLTVESFLKVAAKSRTFELIVVENGPLKKGSNLLSRLSSQREFKPKIGSVTLSSVSDEYVFARMSRVSKVIMCAGAVLSDGGCVAGSGMMGVALAAKYYGVPVIVCAGFYKLTPRFLWDNDTDNIQATPRHLIPSDQGDLIGKVSVINTELDYVPPELVSLYITHTSGYAPSYLYRLINEQYHPDDVS